MAAVMLDGEDSQLIGKHPVVDAKWKSRHEVQSNIGFNHSALLGSVLDDSNGRLHSIEKLRTE